MTALQKTKIDEEVQVKWIEKQITKIKQVPQEEAGRLKENNETRKDNSRKAMPVRLTQRQTEQKWKEKKQNMSNLMLLLKRRKKKSCKCTTTMRMMKDR